MDIGFAPEKDSCRPFPMFWSNPPMPLIMAEVLESESVGLGLRYLETIGPPCEEGDDDEVREDVVMLMGIAVGMAMGVSLLCRGVEG